MTFSQLLTVFFSVGNAVGMILNVKKIPAGWAVVAFAQLSMGGYLAVTGQWVYGIAQYVCLMIALWGFFNWTRQKRGDQHVGPRAVIYEEVA